MYRRPPRSTRTYTLFPYTPLFRSIQTRFALVKHYGLSDDPQTRRITRPLSGSVRVSIEGVEQLMGWSLEPGGWISFTAAPPEGQEVRAGFRFDVPVRFAEDRLHLSIAAFRAGATRSDDRRVGKEAV